MRLLLMRHGEAERHAVSDAERALTEYGCAQLAKLAVSHADLLSEVSKVISSPYLRTRQTAEQLGFSPLTNPAFTPDTRLVEAAAALEAEFQDNLLIVTHQPLIGYLISWLLHGHAHQPEPMQPGQLAVIELDWPAAGLGRLVKMVVPGVA